jgi:hypothetical protein
MNIQTYRTNFSNYNSGPFERKNNSKIVTDPLPKEMLRHDIHGTEQSRQKSIMKRKHIASDSTVFIIMKKFKGTLVNNKLNYEIDAIDIYPTAS